MRRGVWLVVLSVVVAGLGVASARASGTGTTTTATTTTTTTSTTTPSYAPLEVSSLPAGCVGAGAAVLLSPSHPAIALGTPAASLGASAYPSSGSILTLGSSTARGSTCSSAEVSLGSVALFGGAVTASSLQATDGKGTVAGLQIDGSAVTAAAGQTVPVEGWGQLTLGATVGRVTAPLVLRLLQAHDSLPAGTALAVGFAASAEPTAKPKRRAHTRQTGSSRQTHADTTKERKEQPQQPPPYPASAAPLKDGRFTEAVRDNRVVAIALQYLGTPYQWGGGSPNTGFDCSGLVQYVFAQLGVSLVHYAAAQWHTPDGVWVAPNRLRPGDLVFFTGSDGTRKAPGHVGIYVDDGYFIDAPHTGAFVRLDSLDDPKFAAQYVGARRIESRLFVARRLLHLTRFGAFAPAFAADFPRAMRLVALGERLGSITTNTATVRTASHGYWTWAGTTLGGLVLVLGGGLVRRRRSSDACPDSDPPS